MLKIVLICVFCIAANRAEVLHSNVLSEQIIKIYSTTKANPDFILKQSSFGGIRDSSAAVATINVTVRHQKIIGFGGTFTDATGINLLKLSENIRAEILEALFGDAGIGINLCRVPIGGTEYSTRLYTLDDNDGDTDLKKFALQNEDIVSRIPIIKEAQSLRKGSLKLFASAWTAPLWMKDHKVWSGYSMLSEKFQHEYAEYLKKFLDAYEGKGINFWGITTGNLPTNGFHIGESNSMGWLPIIQSEWIKHHFGPVIRNSSHKAITILGHDDFSSTFPYFAPTYVNDEQTLQYLDGLTSHWYARGGSPTMIDFAKNNKKELFLLASDTNYGRIIPVVGNWDKAFKILAQIHRLLQYNYVGWVDYNLVLNAEGGPSHGNVQSDAPIILSNDLKTFKKTPAYYILGHFSKFVIPGSVRVDVTLVPNSNQVYTLAFLRPDNVKVVSIYNANLGSVKLQLSEFGKYSQAMDIPGQSVHSMLYL